MSESIFCQRCKESKPLVPGFVGAMCRECLRKEIETIVFNGVKATEQHTSRSRLVDEIMDRIEHDEIVD